MTDMDRMDDDGGYPQSERSQKITAALRGLVASPLGTITVPVQEFKRLVALAGTQTYNTARPVSTDDAALVAKWRAKLVEMGAP